MIRLSNKII